MNWVISHAISAVKSDTPQYQKGHRGSVCWVNWHTAATAWLTTTETDISVGRRARAAHRLAQPFRPGSAPSPPKPDAPRYRHRLGTPRPGASTTGSSAHITAVITAVGR